MFVRLLVPLIFLASLLILPARAAPPVVAVPVKLWSPADLVDVASIFASRLDSKTVQYARFVSLANLPVTARALGIQGLGYVVNSLSTNDLFTKVQEVPGTQGALAWFDLSQMRDRDDVKGLAQLVKAFDNLGQLGSGAAPFPEPYFHAIISKEYEETAEEEKGFGYYRGSEWVFVEKRKVKRIVTKTRQTVALSPALNKATALGLAVLTGTQFPIFTYDWLATNALSEPRYHELLGLNDSEADAFRLADVDLKGADRVGAQVRGAVIFSEVARRNRILERSPSLQKQGRGTFNRSFDFKTSFTAQDVMRDTILSKADAHEDIFTLPCGLLAYLVYDGQGKRLDKADPDIAISLRPGWHDPQVRSAFMCMDCHLKTRGWVDVEDEVRESARRSLTIASVAVEKGSDRGKRVRQKYLTVDYNELLTADRLLVESAVKTATNGLTCLQTHREVILRIQSYQQEPITIPLLANELGVLPATLLPALETKGISHVFPGLATGRKQRRDQLEANFAVIASVIYLKGR